MFFEDSDFFTQIPVLSGFGVSPFQKLPIFTPTGKIGFPSFLMIWRVPDPGSEERLPAQNIAPFMGRFRCAKAGPSELQGGQETSRSERPSAPNIGPALGRYRCAKRGLCELQEGLLSRAARDTRCWPLCRRSRLAPIARLKSPLVSGLEAAL